MKLFRRKKVKTQVVQVPLPVLIRQVIYDTMLTPTEGIADALGLPPISDEVADMEQQASDDRISNLSMLLPFIDAHADIAAKITAAAYMLEDNALVELPEEASDSLQELFRLISLASSLSCVSTLFSLGLVESKVVLHEQQ
jgi:hypothetical protein